MFQYSLKYDTCQGKVKQICLDFNDKPLDKTNMFSIIRFIKQLCLVKGDKMTNKTFLRADEVSQELGVSSAYAYKLIRMLNEELKERGFLTIPGRVSRKYFTEKLYGEGTEAGKGDQNERV